MRALLSAAVKVRTFEFLSRQRVAVIALAMTTRRRAIERAFELASSRRCVCLADIRRRLKAEGFALESIAGRILLMQLQATLRDAAHGKG